MLQRTPTPWAISAIISRLFAATNKVERSVMSLGTSSRAEEVNLPSTVPSPAEVKQAYHEELHPEQQTALISWLAFSTMFAIVRTITYSIKKGRGPIRNLSLGGTHLHHYLWGILTISAVGGVALRGNERARRHPVVGIAYGSGLALIVDEFALLLDLEDVYWAKEGRVSVDAAIGLISTTGSALAAGPVLRRLRLNRKARC